MRGLDFEWQIDEREINSHVLIPIICIQEKFISQ